MDALNCHPSVAAKKRQLLTELLQRSGFDAAGDSIPRRPASARIPLSFGQQRLWFLDRLAPGTPFYNTPAVVPLDFPVDPPVLERSLAEILRRHEVLRTTFREVDGAPEQVIAPWCDLPLTRHDLTGLSAEARDVEARRLATEETSRPFDLSTGPLVRAALLTLDYARHVLVVTAHHIVLDGWSLRLFFKELSALYPAFAAGRASPLPEPPLQYGDFAVWQRARLQGDVLQRHVDYWERQLERLPMLDIPTDRPRPAVASFRGDSLVFRLSDPLVGRLKALARAEGVTLFMLLLAAFATLLHRYSRQDDIVVGTPVAGRTRSQLEGLIGFFVNTLVLRIDTAGGPSFRELLRRVKATTLGAFAHQDLPFEMLVERLHPQRDLSRNPIFQVSFQLFAEASSPGSEASAPPPDIQRSTAIFDLSFNLWEDGAGLAGQIEYSSDLFDRGTIDRMRGHFEVLLDAVADDVTLGTNELPLLTEAERRQLLVDWNATRRPYARDACVHALFDEQAERTPDAIAVASADEQVTYASLRDRANRIAHVLIDRGVAPDVPVGLCVRRSVGMVAALLGILKAGGAYVPLDPSYPRVRLQFMLADCAAPIVVTEKPLLGHLGIDPAHALCLDRDRTLLAEAPRSDPPPRATAAHLAYVIYTSGSTGQPKGILVPHRGLVNYLQWCRRTYDIASGCGAPVHSSLGFDLTITALFGPLLVGRTVHLLPHHDGAEGLASMLLRQEGFSLVKITPAHLAALSAQLLPGEARGRTRRFVIGGEQLRAEHIAWWRSNAPDTVLVNEYGPSETVVGCCTYEVPFEGPLPPYIPIGRPIDNTELFVLDDRREPVPIGVPGELCIGGDGLARGYLGRPDLTRASFVPHPFSAEPGARLYRTGDLARYRPDGTLEFLGRIDDQVKLRGFRIEPAEIEHAIARHAGVTGAVVVVREDTAGDPRLVAYLVADAAPDPGQLRADLERTLPAYMVPSTFVVLDALPLTSNGKIDRRALPAPGDARTAAAPAVAPRTATERRMAAIWSDVLGIECVGVHDGFFSDLGGHSLLAIRMASRVRAELEYELALREIFEQPTIAGLAALIDARRAAPTVEELRPALRRRVEAGASDVDGMSDEDVQRMLAELLTRESA